MPDAPDAISNKTRAHVGPFVIFLVLLAIPDLLQTAGMTFDNFPETRWWTSPQVWLYSLQTVACGIALRYWWKYYEWRPTSGLMLAVMLGMVGIAIWILPGLLFERLQLSEGWWKYLGLTSRCEGYDPNQLRQHSTAIYFAFLALRFCRLAVIVPLVEEIFWRGFLMRFLVDPDGDFWRVPFGTFQRRSLIVVTAFFVLAHAPADYVAATVYGLLTYWLAVRTKSLAACVVMHATANLLLGIYVLQSGQWGYW